MQNYKESLKLLKRKKMLLLIVSFEIKGKMYKIKFNW